MKVGDIVEYVGRSRESCDQKRGDLGTIEWIGDIQIQPGEWLRGWVLVRWDKPATGAVATHMRADNVRLVTEGPC